MRQYSLFKFLLIVALVIGLGVTMLAHPDSQISSVVAATPPPAPTPRLINGGLTLNLTAKAFLSAYLAPDGHLEVLAEKNVDEKLPIASITKLVTALVAPAADPRLYPMLIESNNEAAVALADELPSSVFVGRMNSLASTLAMNDTYFANPSGLDPDATSTDQSFNYSTAHDLSLLAIHLINDRPDLLKITTFRQYPVAKTDSQPAHVALNTDELLDGQTWSADIIGTKTGKTDLAKKNLLLILRKGNGHLINIVLGSDDHFADMKNLTDWVYGSYEF